MEADGGPVLQKPWWETHHVLPDSEGTCGPNLVWGWEQAPPHTMTCALSGAQVGRGDQQHQGPPGTRGSDLGTFWVVGRPPGAAVGTTETKVPSIFSPCRCGWSWPGSWALGYPSGSWARASITSMICCRPTPEQTCEIQTLLSSWPCLLQSSGGAEVSWDPQLSSDQ